MSEQEQVVALIREVGINRLGNWDGCCCSRFSIRNVDVDIACGKGRHQGLWISSGSLDYGDTDAEQERSLRPIADEVVSQLREKSSRDDNWKVHFREWDRELDK